MPEAVAVAAFDMTTFFEILVIFDTVVSSAIVVPTIVIPATTCETSEQLIDVCPAVVLAVIVTTVNVYVGTTVGDTVGALLGLAEGFGEGLPYVVNVKYTPLVLVVVVESLRVSAPAPSSLDTTVTTLEESIPVPVTVMPTSILVVSSEYTTLDPDVNVHLMVVVEDVM